MQQQQVSAGLCAAAAGLNEASLMAQEENWSTRTNTRSSLPPGYRVPFTPWLKVCGHVCLWVLYLVRSGWGGALQAQLLRDAATVNVKSRLSGHPVDENSTIKSTGQNRMTLQVRAMSWLRWHLTVEIHQTSSPLHLWPTPPTRCPSHAAARTHTCRSSISKNATSGSNWRKARQETRLPPSEESFYIQAGETRRQTSQAVVDKCQTCPGKCWCSPTNKGAQRKASIFSLMDAPSDCSSHLSPHLLPTPRFQGQL